MGSGSDGGRWMIMDGKRLYGKWSVGGEWAVMAEETKDLVDQVGILYSSV